MDLLEGGAWDLHAACYVYLWRCFGPWGRRWEFVRVLGESPLNPRFHCKPVLELISCNFCFLSWKPNRTGRLDHQLVHFQVRFSLISRLIKEMLTGTGSSEPPNYLVDFQSKKASNNWTGSDLNPNVLLFVVQNKIYKENQHKNTIKSWKCKQICKLYCISNY